MLPYVQRVLTKDGEGRQLEGELLPWRAFPWVFNKAKGENPGPLFSCFSLPKNGGEMRWVGPWRAERGIHPGSRNNLLIFFQKGDSLGKMAG